jgi:hypothetical protein
VYLHAMLSEGSWGSSPADSCVFLSGAPGKFLALAPLPFISPFTKVACFSSQQHIANIFAL